MVYNPKYQAATDKGQAGTCFHCGDLCDTETVVFHEKSFCCHGCKSVFELLQSCNLDGYYKYAENPGIKQLKAPEQGAYAYLDDADIIQKVVSFSNENIVKVKFTLPAMHCASCIWLLENFRKLVPGVIESRVNFIKRDVYFTYDPSLLTLRHLVEQLSAIGYPPELKLDNVSEKKSSTTNKRLIYQIGVAGFCFGNIMLLSFPDYIAGSGGVAFEYRSFFGYICFVLALPVLLFSASDYLRSGWRAVVTREINMDVPISLGILALFFRSSFEIFFEGGGGYMDSLAALLFFLLIGKWIQHKTYDSLSFERDYKSYFPISVQVIDGDDERPVGIEKLKIGDRFRVRSGELVPADAILIEGNASIDYSFVSGESEQVSAEEGAKIYAGGRQMGASLVLEVLKPVDQSYLTSLWNSGTTDKAEHKLELLADRVGKRFTYAVVFISVTTGIFWLIRDPSVVLNAVSAVLIVACPCALALSFPFAFGNAVRLLGRRGLYLKNGQALAKMAEVTTIVFDKTGTLTRKGEAEVSYSGDELCDREIRIFAGMAAQSGHPLSRYISRYFDRGSCDVAFDAFREIPGAGLEAEHGGNVFRLGSANFVGADEEMKNELFSRVFISIDNRVAGYFTIDKTYHKGLENLISDLKQDFDLYLVSGDGDGERKRMEKIFGQTDGLHFNQSPHDKKAFIANLRRSGEVTAMIGDGLNDSGALLESDFGVSVADDVFRFAPASDAILSSDSFKHFTNFFKYSKSTLNVVKASFVLSFLYNGIGIMFAVQGILTPVIAAILMPLSSVTVVLFVTFGTNIFYRKYFPTGSKHDKSQLFR